MLRGVSIKFGVMSLLKGGAVTPTRIRRKVSRRSGLYLTDAPVLAGELIRG